MDFETLMKGLDALESKVLVEQRELKDRVHLLEQRQSAPRGEGLPAGSFGRRIAAEVFKAENLGALNKSGALRIETKAATDIITTQSGRSVSSGGVGSPAGAPLGVQNAMTVRPGGSTMIEYFRYVGSEGAAAVQAGEGASKPAVRAGHLLVQQAALTVAGWSTVSKQALTDSAELAAAIDTTLRRSVNLALDAALIDGSITPPFTGLEALAFAHVSATYSNLADATSEAAAGMLEDGFQPTAVCMRPSEWLAIMTATASGSGEYLSGAYLAPLPELLRGLRIVLSSSVPAGKALVVDGQHAELAMLEDFSVQIGWQNDDFVRNQATILGELRCVPIVRALRACRLVTPSA